MAPSWNEIQEIAVAKMGDRLATWAERWGGAAVEAGSPLDPHLTQCGLGRGLPPYQVTSWSIQPFGHNSRNVTLLRVGIPLRTIFISILVVKTFTVRVHWVIARYQLKSSINNVLKLSAKHSKLWEIFTLISPFPPKLLPYLTPFPNCDIFAFAMLR